MFLIEVTRISRFRNEPDVIERLRTRFRPEGTIGYFVVLFDEMHVEYANRLTELVRFIDTVTGKNLHAVIFVEQMHAMAVTMHEGRSWEGLKNCSNVPAPEAYKTDPWVSEPLWEALPAESVEGTLQFQNRVVTKEFLVRMISKTASNFRNTVGLTGPGPFLVAVDAEGVGKRSITTLEFPQVDSLVNFLRMVCPLTYRDSAAGAAIDRLAILGDCWSRLEALAARKTKCQKHIVQHEKSLGFFNKEWKERLSEYICHGDLFLVENILFRIKDLPSDKRERLLRAIGEQKPYIQGLVKNGEQLNLKKLAEEFVDAVDGALIASRPGLKQIEARIRRSYDEIQNISNETIALGAKADHLRSELGGCFSFAEFVETQSRKSTRTIGTRSALHRTGQLVKWVAENIPKWGPLLGR